MSFNEQDIREQGNKKVKNKTQKPTKIQDKNQNHPDSYEL